MLYFPGAKKTIPGPRTTITHGQQARIIRVGDSTNNNQFEYDASSNLVKLVVVTDSNAYPYAVSYQGGVPSKLQSPNFTTNLYYTGRLLARTQVYQNNSPDIQSMVLFNYVNGSLAEQLFYEHEINANTLSPSLKYEIKTLPGGDQ